MSTCKPLRWGILECGRISNDFCVALSALPKEKHVIEFVSELNLQDAKEFAAKFGVLKYTDNFLHIVQDENVDVCYVGTINPTHKDLSIMAMNHSKAVLCEKPVTMNNKELTDVIQCANKNDVFFMEALWTRCFPLYSDLMSKLRSGYYGEPHVLTGSFGTFYFDEMERIREPELGGGVLRDRCIYLLTITDMIFEKRKIKDMKVCSHMHKNGVDRSGSVTLLYEGNKIAYLQYSGDHPLSNDVRVFCSKGKFCVPEPFHCPESYTEEVAGSPLKFDYTLPLPPKEMFYPNSMGLQFEAEHVRECLNAGKRESPIVPHQTSQRIISLIDELYDQMMQSFRNAAE